MPENKCPPALAAGGLTSSKLLLIYFYVLRVRRNTLSSTAP